MTVRFMKLNKNTFAKYRLPILLIGVSLVFLVLSQASLFGEDSVKREEEILEGKLEEMIESLDGISSCEVMVTLDRYGNEKATGEVRGVSVILRGKKRDDIKVRVVLLCSTALGVTSDKIFVSFA